MTAACVVLATTVVIVAWPSPGTGDLFQFWYSGRLVLTGESPYDPAAWAAAAAYGDIANNVVANCTPTTLEPTCVWVYPPATAVVFVPFALLDARVGTVALEGAFVVIGISSLIALAIWMGARAGNLRYAAFGAFAVSHPFVFDLHAGHFEGLGVIGLIALAEGVTRRSAAVALGGLLLSLKPHLYLFVGVVVTVWLVRRRDWRSLAITAALIAAVQVGALLRFPEAPAAILARAPTKTDLGWASTWSFAAGLVPASPTLGVGLALIVTLAALMFAVRVAPPSRRVHVVIFGAGAVSIALSPYTHPYDLVVLFPAIALTLMLAQIARSVVVRIVVISLTIVMITLGTWLAVAANHAAVAVGLPGAMATSVVVLLAITSWQAERDVSRRSDHASSAASVSKLTGSAS